MTSDFVAVDWGTTNRRAYLIRDGVVVSSERDGQGILSVPQGGFGDAVAELRARHDGAPMLLAGMVGSNRGWVDAGYVAAPARLEDLAAAVARPADGVGIVPGVKRIDGQRGDVMRGEEVQLLGATLAGLVPPDALLCQPGTHCKWAWMQGGALTDFVTAMTGEMFSLLKSHALIGQEMTGEVHADDAFRAGVREAQRGDLLASLFGVRPSSLLGLRAQADAASFVSGLLIGSDCRAHVRGEAVQGERVYLLADPVLGALYSCAIEELGGHATLIDSHTAFVTGITRIWELMH
jgi:2-dehydro-3-deoxygalactonokinase